MNKFKQSETSSYRYEKNRKLQRARTKKWRTNNINARLKSERRSRYLNRYGITPARAEEILKSQNDACVICKLPISLDGSSTGANIDHCHKTNVVRGILCHNCNLGLGRFKDDINILCEAIKYLSSYKSNVVIVNAS